jgi:FkbM family methyltransferase
VAAVERLGVRWNLDLREGIDFSIFLLGAFEPGTVRAYRRLVKSGDTVLDIGANVGAHTLPLADLAGATGRVIAFEPTAYAYGKLRANIALNPALASRILALQHMLMADDGAAVPRSLFSSWPLSGHGERHAKHKGQGMSTEGATATTLDRVVREIGLEKIDFIKIDVDGHELPVLRGAARSIDRFRPIILLELSPYVHEEEGYNFDDLIVFLAGRGYRFQDANSGRDLPADPARLRAIIPDGGGINAVAIVR